MAIDLVEADKALEGLLAELKTLKSSSVQIQDAGRTTAEALQVAEQMTEFVNEVLDSSNRQAAAVAKLAETVETQTQAVAGSMAFNRWLLVIVLLLSDRSPVSVKRGTVPPVEAFRDSVIPLLDPSTALMVVPG